jgi:pyruvate/2-oxoglutarate dehydrogenase complex dihydrolipoamide acyltransferase (E2) component
MSSPTARPDRRIDVVLPVLGWAEVRVSVWFARVGDHVYSGDRLVEVVAAGATFDVPAPATGRLAAQRVFPHDVVRPGDVLGAVDAEPE